MELTDNLKDLLPHLYAGNGKSFLAKISYAPQSYGGQTKAPAEKPNAARVWDAENALRKARTSQDPGRALREVTVWTGPNEVRTYDFLLKEWTSENPFSYKAYPEDQVLEEMK